MWPFSNSTSRSIQAPIKPKIHIDLASFAESDKALDVTLTPDIWSMVEWLSITSDSTHIDVIRALLFRALYGAVAYEQLVEHVREQRKAIAKALATSDILRSPRRSTPADIDHVGRSTIKRKLMVPHRMLFDLDRQSAKAGTDLSRYVRSLLFRELQGEVNYNQWQQARAELEEKVRLPSREQP